jgi:hypothetical protein
MKSIFFWDMTPCSAATRRHIPEEDTLHQKFTRPDPSNASVLQETKTENEEYFLLGYDAV